jgi:tetratricopeptide (TPR) repeat protein
LHHTAAAILVAVVVCFVAATVVAEPYEDNPEASARDADYGRRQGGPYEEGLGGSPQALPPGMVARPDNADLHNYLGFSYRNLKQMDLAFKHYKRSIELNPRHRGAHE